MDAAGGGKDLRLASGGLAGAAEIPADRRRRGPGQDQDLADAFIGTSVFVLFDTSNFMYRGFVYAEDAIADFIRGLDRADSVAGDDTALYNGLLLTLRDAAKVPAAKW